MTVFLLAASGVVISAISDKLAEDHGIPYVSTALKIILPAVGIAAGYYLFDASPVMRFLW